MIGLVDANNFYANCEILFRPELKENIVIIVSNNDGSVIARNDKAKALGIPMGEPLFRLKELIKKKGIIVFSSNYTLYGDLSERIMNTIARFSPITEIYSIDESFIDLSGFSDLESYGHEIRNTIIQNVGIPVGVGIAPTKTLAKLANKLSKKGKGVCLLSEEHQIVEALKTFPVGDLWGIGSRYEKLLTEMGIVTALQYRELPEHWVKKRMTVEGLRLHQELHGIPCREIESILPKKKGICTSRSFGIPVSELSELKESVSTYTALVAEKLRKENTVAGMLTVFIQTNYFNKEQPQYGGFKNFALPVATSNTGELISYSLRLLEMIYRKGYQYKRSGVMVSAIVADNQVQFNLFDKKERLHQKELLSAYDSLNQRYGKGTIRFGVEGIKKRWKAKAQLLSPCYTTRWKDIIKAV